MTLMQMLKEELAKVVKQEVDLQLKVVPMPIKNYRTNLTTST